MAMAKKLEGEVNELEEQNDPYRDVEQLVSHLKSMKVMMDRLYGKKEYKFRNGGVKVKEELKTKESESKAILENLQKCVDEFVYDKRREEIVRKKRIINKTYKEQLDEISLEESELDKMVFN